MVRLDSGECCSAQYMSGHISRERKSSSRNNRNRQKGFPEIEGQSLGFSDPNRGKTTNWMRGRVNGTELPISILVDPIIRRPANLGAEA